ncbi:hypothetical protein ACJQWK_10545 [Exserohilum turcicum]|uniref:F-box domain-containing protein n=1 Tax=Exserohilum turcicum (strain 28A) TaxID=671987 RepID=R0JJR9_EXST2|nr:uncharacterized protein SETTUDRAFT_181733 [Exserohilum turcica Et28A]EOA81553.1 hypothetical protein SETTUDRAFT_181733 [Exserohilum turcica Et28A]
MSLAKLSTELDTRILEYLHDDRSALSAMSMVSKYYRRATEQLLYRELEFPRVTVRQIKCLAFTVAHREDVAKHVRSITIPRPRRTVHPDDSSTSEGYESETLKLIGKAKAFCPSAPFFDKWLEDLRSCHVFHKNSISFDGHLALFLTQAINIEKIQLTITLDDSLEICRKVISLDWQSHNAGAAAYPLNKLEDLFIAFNHLTDTHAELDCCVTVAQSLKRLGLPNFHIQGLKVRGSCTAALEELHLQDATLRPLTLVKALNSRQFGNLRRLNLDQIYDPDAHTTEASWYGEPFDNRELSKALIKHTPLLEVFEYRGYISQAFAWPHELESLKGLTKLHTLRVDIDRLVLADGFARAERFDPHHILPPSLRHLELTYLPVERIHEYSVELDKVEKRPSSMQFIVDTLLTFPSLKSLALGTYTLKYDACCVNDEKKLTEAAVKLLLTLAQESIKKCMTFQVYTGDGRRRPKRYFLE